MKLLMSTECRNACVPRPLGTSGNWDTRWGACVCINSLSHSSFLGDANLFFSKLLLILCSVSPGTIWPQLPPDMCLSERRYLWPRGWQLHLRTRLDRKSMWERWFSALMVVNVYLPAGVCSGYGSSNGDRFCLNQSSLPAGFVSVASLLLYCLKLEL